MAPRETENNAYAKFWGDKKEHYGMLWYFLKWSIDYKHKIYDRDLFSFYFLYCSMQKSIPRSACFFFSPCNFAFKNTQINLPVFPRNLFPFTAFNFA